LYKDWFSDTKILQPEVIQVKESPTDVLHDAVLFTKYDITGNAVQFNKVNDMSIVYLWDTDHGLPLCEVKNATNVAVAYTSFETNDKGNWDYTGPVTTSVPTITGASCYNLTGGDVNKSGLISANYYVVSYWTKNSSPYYIAGNTSGYPKQGRTINGWTYFEHRITGQTAITISGANYIDEVRLYPDKAQMTTYTYIPFIGISSRCDINNRISYYEYDSFRRLKLIRDEDNNILKTFGYKYQQAIN
jgi:hypothetical protein